MAISKPQTNYFVLCPPLPSCGETPAKEKHGSPAKEKQGSPAIFITGKVQHLLLPLKLPRTSTQPLFQVTSVTSELVLCCALCLPRQGDTSTPRAALHLRFSPGIFFFFFPSSALKKSLPQTFTDSGFWSLPCCLFFPACGFCTRPAFRCSSGSGERKLWQSLPGFGWKPTPDPSLLGLFVISLTLVVVNTSNLLLTSLELAPCTLSPTLICPVSSPLS